MNEQRRQYIYTYTYKMAYVHIYRPKKEGKPAVFNNLDELLGHTMKWNKPDRERLIWYRLHVESKKNK